MALLIKIDYASGRQMSINRYLLLKVKHLIFGHANYHILKVYISRKNLWYKL